MELYLVVFTKQKSNHKINLFLLVLGDVGGRKGTELYCLGVFLPIKDI